MVSFEDDGAGMAYEHARDFLFRLYASSKEDDQSNAGKFGVGFWSVLLFEPSLILIESRPRNGAAWAVQLDGDLNEVSHQLCNLDGPGTRIVLRRPTQEPSDPAQVAHQVRSSLSQYCSHLKRNDHDATPLPVEVDGTNIAEVLSTAGTVQMRFREKHVEGAVGLGDKPRVELYSRGLLVWRGTLLDELRFGAREADGRQFPPGLAPVYVLNGHRLNVTLDRRAVIDDSRLTEVRVVARRAMRNLLQGYLDKFSPRTPWQRLLDGLLGIWEDAGESGRRSWLVIFMALALALVTALVLLPGLMGDGPVRRLAPISPTPESTSGDRPFLWPQRFDGVGVDPGRSTTKAQLSYTPADQTHYFRVVAFESLDPGSGVRGGPLQAVAEAPTFRCVSDCLDVAVLVDAASGMLPLPLPAGYSIEPSSVRLDGNQIGPLRLNEFGDPMLELPQAIRGALTYRAGPGALLLSDEARFALLAVPQQMTLPESLATLAARALVGWAVEPRSRWLSLQVQNAIAYDISAEVAGRYRAFLSTRPATGWLDFVMDLGRGDCDVKNTVLVVALRKAEVSSRLVMGFVGENGEALPGLHAWVESYVNQWAVLDASGTPEAPVNAPDSPPIESLGRREPSPSGETATSVDRGSSVEASPAAAATRAPLGQSLATSRGTSADDRLQRSTLLRQVALTFGFLSLLLAIAAFGLAAVGRKRLPIETILGAGSAEEIAARLLENAIFRPDLWVGVSDLARRELLPVRGRKWRMTLNEALRRRDRGTLWRVQEEESLAAVANIRRARILDGAHPVFGDVVRKLPGCVDLDEMARLKVVDHGQCPEPLVATQCLVDSANILLEGAGVGPRLLRLCPTGSLSPIRDVDLRRLGGSSRANSPSVYVAVVADRSEIERLVRIAQQQPKLAAFALLELALVESVMLHSLRPWLRVAAAAQLAGSPGGRSL